VSARYTWIGRILSGRRLDRNPLRRGSDRVETVILIALLAACLSAAPLAAHAAARWSSASSWRELRAQYASSRQVTAVLLDASVTYQGYGGGYLASQATARWRAPDGKTVTGTITTSVNAKAGSTMKIWTNRSGQPVTLLGQGDIALRADLAATAATAVLGVLLLVTVTVVRRALNRRRLAAWDADWLVTGPRWNSRR
jgi:hypothetical protein